MLASGGKNVMPSVYHIQVHVGLCRLVIMDIISDLASKQLFVSTYTSTEVCTHSNKHKRGHLKSELMLKKSK